MNSIVRWLSYPFHVCEYDRPWSNLAGVYLFTSFNLLSGWSPPLYVGKTDNFQERMSGHLTWPLAVALRATHVHAMVVPLESLRDRIEDELIQAYQPPLNVQKKKQDLLSSLFSIR